MENHKIAQLSLPNGIEETWPKMVERKLVQETAPLKIAQHFLPETWPKMVDPMFGQKTTPLK